MHRIKQHVTQRSVCFVSGYNEQVKGDGISMDIRMTFPYSKLKILCVLTLLIIRTYITFPSEFHPYIKKKNNISKIPFEHHVENKQSILLHSSIVPLLE